MTDETTKAIVGAESQNPAWIQGVPGDVVERIEQREILCNQVEAASKAMRVQHWRDTRDELAPFGQFKQWCADHKLNYSTVSNAISRAFGDVSKPPITESVTQHLLIGKATALSGEPPSEEEEEVGLRAVEWAPYKTEAWRAWCATLPAGHASIVEASRRRIIDAQRVMAAAWQEIRDALRGTGKSLDDLLRMWGRSGDDRREILDLVKKADRLNLPLTVRQQALKAYWLAKVEAERLGVRLP